MDNPLEDLKQCNILFIESNQDDAEHALNLYHSIFNQVYFTPTGSQALEIFKTEHKNIDLIITEVSLEDMSGIDLISQIRQEYGYGHCVIFATAQTHDDTLLKCLKLGAADYIIKPVLHRTHLGILIKVLKPIYDMKQMYLINQELEIYKQSADSKLLVSKTDLEGNITYVNDMFCTVSGYSKEELLGQGHNIVRHPKTPSVVFRNLWSTIQKGNIWKGSIQNKTKSGESYYVEAIIFPITDDEGNIVEYMSFRQDVTQHIVNNEKIKNALKNSQNDYNKLYEKTLAQCEQNVASELYGLRNAIIAERQTAQTQTAKRNLAEKKLNEISEVKDKEIIHWKTKIKELSITLTTVSESNKKLTKESQKQALEINSLKDQVEIYKSSETLVKKVEEKFDKIVEDKDDVIKYLEDELAKCKKE